MNDLFNKFPDIIKRLLEQIATTSQDEEVQKAQEKLKYQLNNIMDEFNTLIKKTGQEGDSSSDPTQMIMKLLGGVK